MKKKKIARASLIYPRQSENELFCYLIVFFKGRIGIRETFNTLQDTITSSYEELSQNVSK